MDNKKHTHDDHGDCGHDHHHHHNHGPLVNPHRDVGRNDPCPCGSGKKFKKCCCQKDG